MKKKRGGGEGGGGGDVGGGEGGGGGGGGGGNKKTLSYLYGRDYPLENRKNENVPARKIRIYIVSLLADWRQNAKV